MSIFDVLTYSRIVAGNVAGIALTQTEDRNWLELLSESQIRCLHLVSRGMSSKEIAIETGLSPRTVDQYVNQAASVLGASNRREAARKLESFKSDQLNKFQLQSRKVAGAEKSDSLAGVDRNAEASWSLLNFLNWLPPLGGERHDLTATEKIQEIVKAAIIAAVGFGSIVASGAWLQSLFN